MVVSEVGGVVHGNGRELSGVKSGGGTWGQPMPRRDPGGVGKWRRRRGAHLVCLCVRVVVLVESVLLKVIKMDMQMQVCVPHVPVDCLHRSMAVELAGWLAGWAYSPTHTYAEAVAAPATACNPVRTEKGQTTWQ